MIQSAFRAANVGLPGEVTAIIGAQFGDETAQKYAQGCISQFDIVARFNGGPNATHWKMRDGNKLYYSMAPFGLAHPRLISVIGPGTVIDIRTLLSEIDLTNHYSCNTAGRIFISDRSHIMLNGHITYAGYDNLEIDDYFRRGLLGMAPCVAAKTIRHGLRIGDLLHWESFVQKYNSFMDDIERFTKIKIDRSDELGFLERTQPRIKEIAIDTVSYINRQLAEGKAVLADGAFSALNDLDNGTYPMTSAFSTGVAGVCQGLGVPPSKVKSVGVVKAYTSHVSDIEFPTRFYGSEAATMLIRGMEVCVHANENRSLGWLDLNTLRYSQMLNNFNGIVITKLEVLDMIKQIKIATSYKLFGETCETVPSDYGMMNHYEPVYETMEGWFLPAEGISSWEELPYQAQRYVKRIADTMKVPVISIRTGRDNMSMIWEPSLILTD